MDLNTLKNRVKTRMRNLVFTNTDSPLKKLLPDEVRHKLVARFMSHMDSHTGIPAPYEPGMFPKGINLFGFFRAENGLAQGVKLYAGAMEKTGVPHALINTDFLDWLPQNDTTFDGKLSKTAPYAVNVVHINPDQWQEACGMFPSAWFDRHYNIGVFLWELETVPAQWIPIFDHVNEIWAPSTFIADAVRKATDKPVTVIPYGIETPCDEALTRADFGLGEDDFLVLMMYDSNSYASRKNPGGAIDAFAEAFGQTPEGAKLVIKISNPKPEDLAFIEERLGKNGPYVLMTERMERKKLNALIRLCDVYLSLHRSEGFGLVMAEAMSLGVPTVATGWSSNTEFMNKNVSCLTGYDLIPVNDDYQFGDGERVWADAHVKEAAGYLKRLREDPAYRKQIGEAGQKHIREAFSPEACGEKIRNRLEEIV